MRSTSLSYSNWRKYSAFFLFVQVLSSFAVFLGATLPNALVGRSRTCPTLDFTTKSLPRYLFIVFALAGDSTITNDFAIGEGNPLKMFKNLSLIQVFIDTI